MFSIPAQNNLPTCPTCFIYVHYLFICDICNILTLTKKTAMIQVYIKNSHAIIHVWPTTGDETTTQGTPDSGPHFPLHFICRHVLGRIFVHSEPIHFSSSSWTQLCFWWARLDQHNLQYLHVYFSTVGYIFTGSYNTTSIFHYIPSSTKYHTARLRFKA